MSDKKRSLRGKPSSSNPPSARQENPHSPHQWDFESDASKRQQRIRASSWDDSDENSTPIPESKSSRIYSSDDTKIKGSISSEINELKKQFFQSLEKTQKPETSSILEELEQKLFSDRRQSPARVKRRTKSSGSLSPVLEIENQTSPKKSTSRDTDFLDVSPKAFEYDPSFYLNNFFTELRTRRISLLEPISVTENLAEEIPKYDRDCIEMYNELSAVDEKDSYFCKAGRKLSQILEVEESRKDLAKSLAINSEGKTTPRDIDTSPLATARSKKSQKSSENVDTRKNEFKSFSSEYFINCKKLPKPSSGSLSERSANIFDHKLDHEIISLSPKFANTHLATSSKWQEEQPPSTSNQNEEKNDDSLESLTTPDNPTLKKSTRSEKSRQNCNPESPKFVLNIEGNSVRSFKPDEVDITDCCINDSDKNIQTEGSFRSSNRSERSSKGKTEKNSQPGSIESINLTSRSSKHDHSNSSQRSHKKKRNQKNSTTSLETENNFMETNSPAGSFRNLDVESTSQQTSGRSIPEPERTQFGRMSTTPKVKAPRTGENKFLSDKTTPRSTKIPELGLHLDISERSESQKSSQRSLKTADETASDHSNINKPRSRKSERSSSSKSRHTETRTSTPRCYKMTPRGNTWKRSKDSLDNQDSEHSGMSPSRTLEKVCDTMSNSVSSTSRSSLRDLEIPNHQLSNRSQVSLHEPEVFQKESESRRSSRRSVDSRANDTIYNSPTPEKTKSRPNSWTSREEIPENPDMENTDSISESWSFIAEENEDIVEINPTLRNGEEADRYKRLSIINEVSFEDLETSNILIDNEDTKDTQKSRKSKLNSPRTPGSYRSVNKTPKGSTKKPSSESGSIEIGKTDDGKWSELIETFQEGSNSLENNFPGFQDQKEISWDSLKSLLLNEKMVADEKTPKKSFIEKNISIEKSGKMDDDLNVELENRVSLMDKIKQNEDNVPVQNTQNLYYLNVDQGRPFGIGEFGDVTSWNVADYAGKGDKPKDHGDGGPVQKPSQLPHHKPERKEKETKTQRLLWTELREDFRDSKPFLNNLFHGGEEDFDEFTPTTLKTSKSDNYINTNASEGSDCRNSVVSFLLNNDQTEVRVEFTPKTTMQHHSSSESVQSENYDTEFDCEKTPRLSRSLSSLDTRLQDREPSETSNSRSQLFKKTIESSKPEKESTNLSIFLARKEKKDKILVKSNNWLKLRTSDAENPFKQGKKVKRKFKKKGATSSRQGYLSSRSRTPVPSIKLRNSNCFRNFYKRFISVFCLTSNSSAATSK